MTADAEQVLDHAVDGREALQLAGGLEWPMFLVILGLYINPDLNRENL